MIFASTIEVLMPTYRDGSILRSIHFVLFRAKSMIYLIYPINHKKLGMNFYLVANSVRKSSLPLQKYQKTEKVFLCRQKQ